MSTTESGASSLHEKCECFNKHLQYNWYIYVPILLGLLTVVFIGAGLTMVIYGSIHHEVLLWSWGILPLVIGVVTGACFAITTCYVVVTIANPGAGLSH
jgi:hypothetical protein